MRNKKARIVEKSSVTPNGNSVQIIIKKGIAEAMGLKPRMEITQVLKNGRLTIIPKPMGDPEVTQLLTED